MNKKTLSLLIGAALLGTLPAAHAITDEEGNASIQFSFVPPGARSLGMAGAFLGRADDATAAYTNPAGLTQLVQPEVSAEGRHISYGADYAAGGTFSSSPFDISNVDYDTAEDEVNGLAYFSVVWPHDRWSLAFYRHELVKYEVGYTFSRDLSATDIDSVILPYTTAIDLDVTNYGLSGAFKVSDAFSIGASIIYSDFELDSFANRFDATVPFTSTQHGDDDDIAFNVGALFKFSDRFSMGVVYRDGPEFDMEAGLFANEDPDTQATGFPRSTDFSAPDIFGVGLAFQPADAWIVTFDVNRVYYSDLTDALISGFRSTDVEPAAGVSQLEIDDGTEVRLGAEYTFLETAQLFSLRGGVWRDPAHTINFDGVPVDTGNALSNAVIFSTGDDEIHWSIGAGAVFNRFQIDAAFDFSDNVDTFSISGVLRFE